jgi:hypothetical protein
MLGARRFKFIGILTGFLLLCFSLSPAEAASANISHAYQARGKVPGGSLVSLDPAHTNYVVLTNTDNARRLVGVAVSADDSLLAVNASESGVQIATNGSAKALVSTVNGSLKVGDQVGASAFNGVGAKAAPGEPVIGLAQSNFSDGAGSSKQITVSDLSGRTHRITVGYVDLTVGTGATAAERNLTKLNALQRLAYSLTGHVVPTLRILLSLAVAIMTLLILATLMYSSVYSGIISIGRNPLAKYAVLKSVGSIVVMAVALSIVSLAIMYWLLY